MKARTKLFGVQRVSPGRAEPESESTLVEALTAPAAAEAVLGRQLATVGPPQNLRAVVWHMQADFSPICTHLYDPANASVADRSTRGRSTTSREEMRIHRWIIGVALVVSCAVAGVVLLR